MPDNEKKELQQGEITAQENSVKPRKSKDPNHGWNLSQQNDTAPREAKAPQKRRTDRPANAPAAEAWDGIMRRCHYVGAIILRECHSIRRSMRRMWKRFNTVVPVQARRVRSRVMRRLEKNCDDLLFPYRVISHETGLLWHRLTADRKAPESPSAREAFRLYRRATARPYNRIANFFAPIFGIAILAGAISYFSDLSFALKVDYNGETLGYIAQENDFYSARDAMLDRLINEEYIPPEDTIPTLSLAIVHEKELMGEEALTNAIMRASGNELIEANGFYLEGKFLGAIKNGDEFLTYMDKILSHYRTGEEHEVVRFTKNIRLEKGVYPASSAMTVSDLQNYLRSDDKLARTYSAVQGDTLEGIAKRYNMSVEELFDLNDGLERYLTNLQFSNLTNEILTALTEQAKPVDPDVLQEDEQASEKAEPKTAVVKPSGKTTAPKTAGEKAAEAEPVEEELPLVEPLLLDDALTEDELLELQSQGYVIVGNKAYTVEDMQKLVDARGEIELLPLEKVSLQGGEELLVANVNITLGIQVTRRETYIRKVPYGTTYQDDNTKPMDWAGTVVRAGIYGSEEITSDITYIDGQQAGETILSRTTLSEPVNQVLTRGTLTLAEYLGETGGKFIWPVDGGRFNGSLTSYRGHTGMDIGCPVGTAIRASKAGTVTTALNYGWNYGYGKTVVINHGNGQVTRYAHMSNVTASVGQYVQQGQIIGYSGNTGNSSGPHCHFEIRINGVIQAPEKYIGYYYNR